MAKEREDPYGAFNYSVTVQYGIDSEITGGFSEVSGFNTEITYAEYREGTAEEGNHPRKIPLMYKVGDITLKRGLLGRTDLWKWVSETRNGNREARATVTINLMSEDIKDKSAVATWELRNARPSKWTGPTLTAAGGSDVAMEELVLVCDDIIYL